MSPEFAAEVLDALRLTVYTVLVAVAFFALGFLMRPRIDAENRKRATRTPQQRAALDAAEERKAA